jgi:glycosyltransferase involved in cell wall biosynthesis
MSEIGSITVLIVTYNHAGFIAQAIDSVLMQECSVPFEIIISEDASTDGTRDIVEKYAKAHPDRISLLLSERNVASNEVIARGLRNARGRYICMLDGDDFWTSKSRLQTQYQFLENHPEASALFGNALVARGIDVGEARWTSTNQPQSMSFEDIWLGNPFATCTGMMRASSFRNVPSWYAAHFPITDWPLYVLCARNGNLCFVDEVVGVYRLHGAGMFTPLPDKGKRDAIEQFYRRMFPVLTPAETQSARAGCSSYFSDLAKSLAMQGDIGGAFDCLRRSLRSGQRRKKMSLKAGVKSLVNMVRYTR